jgi:hypothetical protein
MLSVYIEEKHVDAARELIADFTAERGTRIPKFLARAAAFVERLGERDWALTLYERGMTPTRSVPTPSPRSSRRALSCAPPASAFGPRAPAEGTDPPRLQRGVGAHDRLEAGRLRRYVVFVVRPPNRKVTPRATWMMWSIVPSMS